MALTLVTDCENLGADETALATHVAHWSFADS